MAKRQVFYSFHFDNDVMRVQQIRNMGALEDNKPVSPNEWEEVKKKGNTGIQKWIDDNMKNRSCVVVLIGEETAARPWVKYEIEKAWRDKKGLLGIHINNLKDPVDGTCSQGKNPFDQFEFTQNGEVIKPAVYTPPANNAYSYIKDNIEKWIEAAIKQRS